MTMKSADFLSSNQFRSIVHSFNLRVDSSGYLLVPTPSCPRITGKFNQRVSSSGYLLPPSAGCPPEVTREAFVQSYAFDIEDLVSRMDNQVIVYHGELPHSVSSRLYFLYRSSPIIYAHRALGPIDLSVEQIRDIIEGRVSEWGVLGQGDKPIIPLCHAGEVHNAVFRAIAEQNFGVRQIRKDLGGFNSYEGLAKAASEKPGSLVFGLRPEFARDAELRPISISGKWPGLPVSPNEYPSLRVWLSLPDNCSVQALIHYLNLVAGRLEKDVLALRKLTRPVPGLRPGSDKTGTTGERARVSDVLFPTAIHNT